MEPGLPPSWWSASRTMVWPTPSTCPAARTTSTLTVSSVISPLHHLRHRQPHFAEGQDQRGPKPDLEPRLGGGNPIPSAGRWLDLQRGRPRTGSAATGHLRPAPLGRLRQRDPRRQRPGRAPHARPARFDLLHRRRPPSKPVSTTSVSSQSPTPPTATNYTFNDDADDQSFTATSSHGPRFQHNPVRQHTGRTAADLRDHQRR